MPVNNGLITAPVSIDDVKSCLGVAGDLSNDVAYLCENTHGKINKWAKYKPIRRSELFCQDRDPSAGNYVERWWWGEDYKCGLQWEVSNPGGYYPYILYQMRANYQYLAPFTSLGNPQRLGDFVGYYHGAKPPIVTFITKGQTEQVELIGTDNGINFGIAGTTESYGLKWSDFGLGNYYFTVYIHNDRNEFIERVVSETPYNDFGDNVVWNVPSEQIGQTFIIYYVLIDNNNNIFTIPYSDDNYYTKTIRTILRSRYIRPIGLYTNSIDGWYDLTLRDGNLNGNPSARIRVQVEKIPQAITFNNTQTYFKTETQGADGILYTSIGKLTSETGVNIPTSVTIPAGQSGTENVYYEFGGMYPPAITYPGSRVLVRFYITYNSGVTWNYLNNFYVVTN